MLLHGQCLVLTNVGILTLVKELVLYVFVQSVMDASFEILTGNLYVAVAGRRHPRRARGGEKNSVPPPNRRALDWSVVLTVGRLSPIVPQDNVVVSNNHNKHKLTRIYPGNALACPGLEAPTLVRRAYFYAHLLIYMTYNYVTALLHHLFA